MNTPTTTLPTTVPSLHDHFAHEEVLLRHLASVKNEEKWILQELASVRKRMEEDYPLAERQAMRAQGWGIVRI